MAALQKAQAVAQAEAETAGLTSVERAKAVALAKAQAAAQQDVKNELRETAVLTDDEKSKILGAAEATAQWKQQAKETKEAINFAKDLTGDVAKGFIGDLMNGAKAADALNNALKRVVQTLANKAIDQLIGGLFSGGGGGNIFGALFGGFGGGLHAGTGGLYASGGYTGPGGNNTPAGVVHKGEYVFTKAQVKKLGLGNLEALSRGYANGGFVGSTPSVPSGLGRSSGPNIIVQNTQSQNVQATPKQESNGDITVLISAVEGRIADNMLRGRGPLNAAIGAKQSNRQLRG